MLHQLLIYKFTGIFFLSVMLSFNSEHFIRCNSYGKSNTSIIVQSTTENSIYWYEPDTIIGGIPVYHHFESLEPLLHMDNDTTYIINFWATWCKPCIEELPILEEINSDYRNKKVRVVLISLDLPSQLESKLIPFVRKQELRSKMVVLLDGKYNVWIDKVSPEWTGAIPATYIYKRDQNILEASAFESKEELKNIIKPFLLTKN